MIDALVTSEFVWRIGWTLLHSLWQVLIVGLITALALAATSRRSANVRYRAASIGMAAMFLSLVITFVSLPGTPGELAPPSESVSSVADDYPRKSVVDDPDVRAERADVPDVPVVFPSTDDSAIDPADDPSASLPQPETPIKTSDPEHTWLMWIVAAWVVGVCLFSVWNVSGWILIQRLRSRTAVPVAAALQQRLDELARQMRISRPVRLMRSLLVDAPLMLGWLRPVVLLPLSLTTSLTPFELDAVLSHELAHVRRRDYLINLLQAMGETLLFYHPAVWWLSGRIRIEREFCCDDLAISICGDRVRYARTLATVEETRTCSFFAMSLLGRKKNMTLERIRRILGDTVGGRRNWLSGVCALLLLVGASTGFVLSRSDNLSSVEEKIEVPTSVSDGGRKRSEPIQVPGIDPGQFRLDLLYRDGSDKPYYNLTLSVPPLMQLKGVAFSKVEQISEQQARDLIKHLAATGYFKHARPIDKSTPRVTSGYVLQVRSGAKSLREDLGWDFDTLRRLDSLHRELDGKSKDAMSMLLARLAGQRSIWSKGKVRDGLQAKLSADRLIYGSGRPIPITLTLANVDTIRHSFVDPRIDFDGLSVVDEQGRKVPYLSGPSQLQELRVTIDPGKARTLASFDLASRYYLRRTGRYVVHVPDSGIPASNKLLVIVKPDPAGARDPVGRLLPLLRNGWTIAANPNFEGKVRPGSNYDEVPGLRVLFTQTPTGTRRDLAFVWLWLTEKAAREVTPEPYRSDLPPHGNYLGEIAGRHVYLHVSEQAMKRWPNVEKDIKRALSAKQATTPIPARSGDDVYRGYHDRYKAMILKAALAGRSDKVEKLTDNFNSSIDGRLLFVQVVSRTGPLPAHKTVLSKFFGNRKITIGKLGFTYGSSTIVSHNANDGYAVIATNPLKANQWPDDLQVTMAVAEKPAVSKPKTDDGFGKETKETPGLRLKIHAAKAKYEVGETIEVLFTFKNVSNREMVLVDGTDRYRSHFHGFDFAFANGKKIAQVSPDLVHDEKAYVRTRIPPGKTIQHKVALNHWKLAGLGHAYTNIGQEARTIVVTGIYATPKGLDLKIENQWGGMVRSKPLQIEIVKPKVDDGFGKESRGLRLKIHTAKEKYQVGEKIEVLFTLKNVSDRETVVFNADESRPSDFHQFAFAFANGKRIAHVPPQPPVGERGYRKMRIPPGKTIRHKVVLNHWKLAGLGHPYTNIGKEARAIVLTGTYFTPVGLDTDGTVWHGSITSEPLKVEIAKPAT